MLGSQTPRHLDATENPEELRMGAPILLCTQMLLGTMRNWEQGMWAPR